MSATTIPSPWARAAPAASWQRPSSPTSCSLALRDKAATPFRVPRAIELIPIDAKSGQRAIFGKEGVILEAFKPGDEPPDATKIIGEGTVAAGACAGGGRGAGAAQQGGVPTQQVPQDGGSGGLTPQGGGLY